MPCKWNYQQLRSVACVTVLPHSHVFKRLVKGKSRLVVKTTTVGGPLTTLEVFVRNGRSVGLISSSCQLYLFMRH
eukprot:4252186-Amphidinium_carterae.1